MSRTERENASKRSRALATFGSIARSKTRCRSYRASAAPTNGMAPDPYRWRSSETLVVLVVIGTTFAESGRGATFVLIGILVIELSETGCMLDVNRGMEDTGIYFLNHATTW